MLRKDLIRFAGAVGVSVLVALPIAGAARADDIVVSNYGVAANGMPFAIAKEKGFFKKEGADVSRILSSAGGGTTLRNMLAGSAPYAEVSPNAVIAAIQHGADIKIISDNVLTVAEFTWAVKPDSPIKSVKDLKGKKIAYTNPRSTSQALATLVLQTAGLDTKDATLVKTGGFGNGIAALDSGLVDCAPIPEPLWSKYRSKYREIAKATKILKPITNVVGVASMSQAKSKGKFIRAVIRARIDAVKFMEAHPDEAGDIVAKEYNLDQKVAREAVTNLVKSRTDGLPYWSTGQIYIDGLKRAIKVQKMVGAISGNVDAKSMIDTEFLPKNLQAIK